MLCVFAIHALAASHLAVGSRSLILWLVRCMNIRVAVVVLACCVLGQYLIFFATPDPLQSSTPRWYSVVVLVGIVLSLPMLPLAYLLEQLIPPLPAIVTAALASFLTSCAFWLIAAWLPKRRRHRNI